MSQVHDFEALEQIEFEAMSDFFRAAPEPMRATYAIEVRDIGPVTCQVSRDIEPAAIFRRAVGLGVRQPATQADLDATIAHMAGTKTFAIPLAAQNRPAELASWLEQRGFTRGYAWMKFRRPCQDAPRYECDLDIRVVGRDQSEAFGRVVTGGFGLPAAIAPWIGELAGRRNWVCVMAFAGDNPGAAGAAYVQGEYAWLGLGATLPEHRRHGAQNALLARRLNEAAARGARVAVTETGERLPDRPSNSYRNILRAGFQEMYLRQNYVSAAK
jgi:GNAT superfamily N-acetyltransferase